MPQFTCLIVGHLLLAKAITAMAQTPPSTENAKAAVVERLQAADANGDRYIDRKEAEAKLPRVAKNFDRLDTDQDGRLSTTEMQAAAERMRRMRR